MRDFSPFKETASRLNKDKEDRESLNNSQNNSYSLNNSNHHINNQFNQPINNSNSILNNMNFNNFSYSKDKKLGAGSVFKGKDSSHSGKDEKKDSVITKPIKCLHAMSKMGFAGYGVKKVNQDNYFVYKNFINDTQSIYFSVLDGHGQNGHDVSKLLKEHLPVNMNREICCLNKESKDYKVKLYNTIEEVFLRTNNELNTSGIDTMLSGSTCVSMVYTPEKLIMANIGDSRAVIGRCVNGGNDVFNLIL